MVAEVEVAWRVGNDPSASLSAQQAHANLLHASGRGPAPPLKDPSPWLAPERVGALRLRLAAVQALRAALFADPHTAVSATLEQLRYLPAWTAIRAATLRSCSPAAPPTRQTPPAAEQPATALLRLAISCLDVSNEIPESHV